MESLIIWVNSACGKVGVQVIDSADPPDLEAFVIDYLKGVGGW